MKMPTFYEFMNPTLEALERLGGSGTIDEIVEQVLQRLNLPDDITTPLHNPEKSSQTEVEYRMAWARSYLKKYGLITNSARAVWAFTEKFTAGLRVNPEDVVQEVRLASRPASGKKRTQKNENAATDQPELMEEVEPSWRETLHQQLLTMAPDAFERLSQRILRESGFVQVEVTGQTGDGGIDGKGIVKIQGILSYHVVFQCKRYKASVGSSAIRDFRGAMVGRADKGLFITTGTFTRDAKEEAIRPGTSPIDLIDGDDLVEMLKELRLGVNVKMLEEVEVDCDWFKCL